jgi:hypothetical protein
MVVASIFLRRRVGTQVMQNFERYAFYVLLAGLTLVLAGYLCALLVAFRTKVAWGVASILFPPASLLFCARHARQAKVPLGLLSVGGLMIGAPFALNAVSPHFINLGPLENRVDGELHLTLTGWDRKSADYAPALQTRPHAVVLQMANPDVTDATLELLRPFHSLRELDLNDTQVTDVGLKTLAELPKLKIVRLRNTKISDEGFQQSLAPLDTLEEVDVRGTSVRGATLRAWKSAKPGRKELH